MVSVAIWLKDKVGLGEVFTKQDLREAFPNISQVDRRMRDLREFRWVIDTNKEDGALLPHELRLVFIGDAVWAPGAKRKTGGITPKVRRALMVDADFACRACGVRAGTPFPDEPRVTATLGISTVKALNEPAGEVTRVVLCQKCAGLSKDLTDLQRAERKLAGLLSTLSVDDIATYQAAIESFIPVANLESAILLGRRLQHFRKLGMHE